MLRCSRHFLSTLALVTAVGTAHAAELGEARVSSHIGQPLVADIELAMVDDPAQAVAVRVASPEVYNGAGIAVPPVLANLNLSVMRRDGRQFLHVTSLRPIDSEHLHLYLELTDKGQRTVRLATLWLTPDPNPAPAPAPVPMPAAAPRPATVARAEPALAVPPAPVRKPVAVRKPELVAAASAEEEGIKQPPAKPHARTKPAAAALPLPIHAPQAPAPAACSQQTAQAQVCAALDGKTAELNAKIGTLEGKVKSLQATLGAAPAAVKPAPVPAPAAEHAPAETAHAPAETEHAPKAAPAPAPAPEAVREPPGPKPISAIKPLVPRKHKTPPPEPDSGMPWGWIGAGAAVLLALGGAALLLRRRAHTVRNVDIPAAPRLIDRVRHSFASRGKAGPDNLEKQARAAAPEAAQEATEPSFE